MKKLKSLIILFILIPFLTGFRTYGGGGASLSGGNTFEGDQVIEGAVLIDDDNVECFLVRQDGDAQDIFKIACDTATVGFGTSTFATNSQVEFLIEATRNILIDGRTNPRNMTEGVMRFIHLPLIDNTRALSLDIDASSRTGTMGMVIDFTATGLAAGERGSGYTFNGITANSTGGVAESMTTSKSGAGSASVHASHINPGVDPIHQESGTFGVIEQGWDENGGFADTTAAFNSSGTNVTIFDADDDYIYIGDAAVFDALDVSLATAANRTIKPVFEFSAGSSTWTVFPPSDGTNGFSTSGIIGWMNADLTGWSTDTVNAVASKYWIRIKRTQNSITTDPIENTIQVAATTTHGWDEDGNVIVAQVDINSTSNASLVLDAATDSDPAIIYQENNITKFYTGVDGDDGDKYKISGDGGIGIEDFITVQTDGKVGINTTISLEPLTIDTSADDFGGLEITNSDSGSAAQAGIILRTVYDASNKIANAGTYGWQLTARGDTYTVSDQREDLMLEYYDNTAWRYIAFFEHDTGNMGLGTSTFGTNAAKVFGIANGTAPTTSPADMVQMYAEDLSPGNSGIVYRFEGGDNFIVGGDGTNVLINTTADGFVFNKTIHIPEVTTPTPIADLGSIYPKTDNCLYFQDGAGAEHLVHCDSHSNIWFHGVSTVVPIADEDTFSKVDTFVNVGSEDDLGNAVGSTSTNDITIAAGAGGSYDIVHHLSMEATGASKEMVIVPGVELATPLDITNVTDNTVSPIVITIVDHGRLSGDMVEIVNVAGNTNANGSFMVANETANTFEILILGGAATTGNGDYNEGSPTGDVTIIYPGNLVIHPEVSQLVFSVGGNDGDFDINGGDKVGLYVANLDDGTDLNLLAVSLRVKRIGD